MSKVFAIGLDLGRHADSSALAVVESVMPPEYESAGCCPPEFLKLLVRHLHRFPPGTRPREIAKYVSDLLNHPELTQRHTQIYLVVDQTAVGDPIAKLIERLVQKEACRLVIEGRHGEAYSNGVHYVPKQTIVSGIDASLDLDNFIISQDLDETQNLIEELVRYRDQPTTAGSLKGDVWREEQSDDLVFAVGIACWKLRNLTYFIYERL
jgi:hypothetical protein